ncbi:MAG: VanW family protein [Clostridia bacterium]
MEKANRVMGACMLALMTMLILTGIAGIARAENATLASAKTPLDGSGDAKISNIELAVAALDGLQVDVGQSFSFNDSVGPRTSSYGYKNALNGRGVKVLGGGVAQVASTMYLALKKLDGIDYLEKKTYQTFTENYVASKKDAILVDYKGDIDFQFENQSDRGFQISLWLSNDYLNCALLATDEDVKGSNQAGDGTAQIYLSGSSAMQNNITLAADSIYDTALCHGDTFSFNQIVGPRTERYGYQPALNGRGVKTVGGGVAQVASLIYLAVEDLPSVQITEKSVYKDFNQDYVSDADAAICVDYNDGQDFRFTYDGYGTLYIYTHVSDDTLYCEVVEY